MGGIAAQRGAAPFLGRMVLLREWLAFGNLNNGVGNAGLSCLNGNNALSNANWNILARNSGKLMKQCTVRRLRETAAGGKSRPTLRGKLIAKTAGLVGNERPVLIQKGKNSEKKL